VISPCQKYRYALSRTWDESKSAALFIGLNPSTADEKGDDPTLRRCVNFAKSWGYGGVCMANLFAYRATKPEDLKLSADPIGPDNGEWLIKLSEEAGIVIAAWGNDGLFLNRSAAVKAMILNMHCLKVNKTGEPAHPLYQPASAKPVPFSNK